MTDDELPEPLAVRAEAAVEDCEGGEWRDGESWSAETAALVRSNEISFLLRLASEPAFVRDQRAERDRLLAALKSGLSELNEHDVPFSLIKFPAVPKPIGDIDMLIPEGSGQRAAFAEAGFELQNLTEPHREAYVRTIDDGLVTIDVHTKVSWRRVEYLDADEVIEDRVFKTLPDGTTYPAPRDAHELLIVAAHSLFDKGQVTLFEALYGHHLAQCCDLSEARTLAHQFNWEPVLERFLAIAAAAAEPNGSPELAEFPVHVRTRDVIGFRIIKVSRDVRHGRFATVLREAVGYPQDVVIHLFEDRLGVSLWPVFRAITRAKRWVRNRG